MSGLKFGQAAGGAQKNRADSFEPAMGDNSIRMFGDLLARYVYWVPNPQGKGNIPVECLGFNRLTEKFDNVEKDWVKEYYPDIKCQWAYAILCIDPKDNKVKIWNMKSKLTQQIMKTATEPDLGDPTDIETGWDIEFSKNKTGPLPINIGYELNQRRLKQRPLTDEERELVANSKTIVEMLPRQTPEQQKEFLEKLRNGGNDSGKENIDESIGDDFADVT